ncbi:kunitz-like peptide PcKuz1 [Drosophila willistoni]|uniref:kunitz-like peptide PcKuz1 n=1 Tax=Drosophila willistoni TaxID=7260 RepID=UPI001F07F441|nr:kunitz-like peptide PcKuz1 [Drosophila willistoni]
MVFYCLFLFLLLGIELVFGFTMPEYYQREAICKLPPNYGNCGHQTYLWYFDYSEKNCKRFIYSVCGGNRNRFYTLAECTEFCDIPHD